MLHHDPAHIQHTSCLVEPLHKPVNAQQLAQAETVFLLVRGMGCPTCAQRVRNALLQIEGVVAADIHLEFGVARVWYAPQVVHPETLGTRLLELADDGRHHYTAQVIVFSGEPSGEVHASSF